MVSAQIIVLFIAKLNLSITQLAKHSMARFSGLVVCDSMTPSSVYVGCDSLSLTPGH